MKMHTLLSLNELLESTDTHYTGDCHFVNIDNHQYSFIKGFLNYTPPRFKHKLYNVHICQPATYIIQEFNTGYVYIGSSGNFYSRIIKHKFLINKKEHDNKKFTELLKTTDINNFELTVIFTSTREEAYDIEQLIVDHYKDTDQLINIASNVRYAMRGVPLSEEHKEKLRKSNTGRLCGLDIRRYISYVRKTNKLALEQMKKIHENKRRRIMVNEIEYRSLTEAIVGSGINKTELRKKLNKNDPNVYWLGKNASPIIGRPLSSNHIDAIRAAKKDNPKTKIQFEKYRSKNDRKIILDGVLYNSVTEAVRITGFPECSIHKQLRGKKDQLVDGAYVLNFKKHVVNKVIIDGIVYDGVKQASEKLSINLSTLRSRIKSGTVKYYQEDKPEK